MKRVLAAAAFNAARSRQDQTTKPLSSSRERAMIVMMTRSARRLAPLL